jgi:hypothetical protein
VTLGADQFYSWEDLAVFIYNLKLSPSLDRLPVVSKISSLGSLVWVTGILVLFSTNNVGCIGEGRKHLLSPQVGIPATVVKVQMCVDHDVDIVRIYVYFSKFLKDVSGVFDSINIDFFLGILVSATRVDQDILRPGLDK